MSTSIDRPGRLPAYVNFRNVSAAAAVLLALTLPFWSPSTFVTHVGVICLIYVPLAVGQNLVVGNSGQVAMGHSAFYGVGAFTAAYLAINTQLPALLVLVAAVVAAGIVGFAISLPAVRVSGDYVFIVTIGLNLIFLDVVTQWRSVTGGANGLPGIPLFSVGGWQALGEDRFYWVAIAASAVSVVVALALTRSRLGRTILAVRDDVMAAEASGIRPTGIRVTVLVAGAGLAGLAGALLAYYIGFVGPQNFTTQQSLLIFEMAIIGGLGSIRGSILGAVLLVALPEVLQPLQDYRLGIGGLLVILLMIFRPNGLIGAATVSPLVKR